MLGLLELRPLDHDTCLLNRLVALYKLLDSLLSLLLELVVSRFEVTIRHCFSDVFVPVVEIRFVEVLPHAENVAIDLEGLLERLTDHLASLDELLELLDLSHIGLSVLYLEVLPVDERVLIPLSYLLVHD